jgi:predicted permease
VTRLDLIYAARRLASAPVATLLSVSLLAVGIGATMAVSTLLHALVFRTLPVGEPDRLALLSVLDERGQPASMTLDAFEILAADQSVFEAMAGFLPGGVVPATANGQTRQVIVDAVTDGYFTALGIGAATGRVLQPSDFDAAGRAASPACVLSHRLWRDAYGGSTAAIGARVSLGETSCEVVGVLPPTFSGIQIGVASDLIVPAPLVVGILGLPADRPAPISRAVARLRQSATLTQARAQMDVLWARALAETRPAGLAAERQTSWSARRLDLAPAATGFSFWRDRYARPLTILAWATAFLLIVSSANLAAYQLARALNRLPEFAMRRALGASRWQIVRPVLFESALVSASGAAVGLLIASVASRAAVRLLSSGGAGLALDLSLDGRLWWLVIGVTTGVTVGSGLVPAWLATHSAPSVGAPFRVVPARRWSQLLVVTQVAVSLALLAGAGVVAGVFVEMARRDPGFAAGSVAAAQLTHKPGGYTDMDDDVYYPALVERLSVVPGVRSVALAKPTPAQSTSEFLVPVRRLDDPGAADVTAAVVTVSPGYFATLGIPFVAGRDVAWSDTRDRPPVAVVSRALASRLLPAGDGSIRLPDAVGLTIAAGREARHQRLTIAGIADDASVLNVRSMRPSIVYVAMAQQPPPYARWPGVLIRTMASPASLEREVSDVVDGLGHEFVTQFRPLDVQIALSLTRERLLAGVSATYGLLALALVGIGLTALLSHDVVARTREFGVRLAVGASPASLRRRIVLRGVWLSACGVGLGAPLAIGARAAVTAVLGDTGGAGLAGALAASAALLAVSALATAGPGRRAARVDPAVALRAE